MNTHAHFFLFLFLLHTCMQACAHMRVHTHTLSCKELQVTLTKTVTAEPNVQSKPSYPMK